MPTPSLRRLSLESLPVAALKPDARTPRIHSGRQIKQIARSINSFGFNVPILIDRDNNVVAGHGRLSAAKSLGWQEVPATRLDHLSPAQARAFAIADNRLTEISTWDERLLGEVFRDLAVLELDFSLEDTGFSMAEIDLRIEGLSSGAEPSPDPADQISDLVGHEPVSKPGDLWALGESRIVCADALDRGSYGALMQEAKADAVFTDPPFNVPIHGHTCGNGAIRHREFAMASGEMTEGQFGFFLTSVLYLLAQQSAKGSIHYICIDWRHLPELLAAGKQTYSRLLNLCVWAKNNPGLGSFYRSGHEMILVFPCSRPPESVSTTSLSGRGRRMSDSTTDRADPIDDGSAAATRSSRVRQLRRRPANPNVRPEPGWTISGCWCGPARVVDRGSRHGAARRWIWIASVAVPRE